jgi:hydroxymethylglutaryl-CoA lyase
VTEDLVFMFEAMGVRTGIDLTHDRGGRRAERLVGRTLPSQVLRAGPRTRRTDPDAAVTGY